jgi:small-conductance mechanosensitive channel
MLEGLNLSDPTVRQFIGTGIVLGLLGILLRVARGLIYRYVPDPARQYRASKAIRGTLAVFTIVVIVAIWSPRIGGIATLLTVVGAGLAIALRELLLNVAGWMLILLRRLFESGDRIEINGLKGDVLDIRLQHTLLMEVGGWVDAEQSTGRLVHVPNSSVLQDPVFNYTRGFHFIWNEIPITVTFRSDWRAAHDIMVRLANESAAIVEQQAAEEMRSVSHEFLLHFSVMTPFVYVRIVENGVRLTLRFLCEVRKRRGMEHALTVGMLDEFRSHGGIELAYPMLGLAQVSGPQFGEDEMRKSAAGRVPGESPGADSPIS